MKHGLGLVIVLLLFSCNNPVKHRSYEIIKVELSRSGAWADFGATLSVDTSLNFKYYGDYGNRKQSYFIGKVSSNFWDTLNQKLEQIEYKTLPASDNKSISDANYFELIIHGRNGVKHITRLSSYPIDSVLSVMHWLDTSYRKLKLHPVKDTLQFESKYYKLKMLMDKVQFAPVRFPPTLRKRKYRNLKSDS